LISLACKLSLLLQNIVYGKLVAEHHRLNFVGITDRVINVVIDVVTLKLLGLSISEKFKELLTCLQEVRSAISEVDKEIMML